MGTLFSKENPLVQTSNIKDYLKMKTYILLVKRSGTCSILATSLYRKYYYLESLFGLILSVSIGRNEITKLDSVFSKLVILLLNNRFFFRFRPLLLSKELDLHVLDSSGKGNVGLQNCKNDSLKLFIIYKNGAVPINDDYLNSHTHR